MRRAPMHRSFIMIALAMLCIPFILTSNVVSASGTKPGAEAKAVEKPAEMTTAQRMFGQAYPKIEAKGAALDKELAVVTVDGIFNKIYARESQLDLKTRELCTISFLTALGRPDELGIHLVVAFNLGWTFEELREAMLLAVVPAGWPASLDAISKLYSWCKEHEIPVTPGPELRDGFAETDWYKAGYDNGVRLFGEERWTAYLERLSVFDPDLVRFTVTDLFGVMLTRKRLDERAKALCMVAGFAALGAQDSLALFIVGAYNSGVTATEVKEVLYQVGFYAGQNRVLQGLEAFKQAQP